MGFYRVHLLYRYEEVCKKSGKELEMEKKTEKFAKDTAEIQQFIFSFYSLVGTSDRSKENKL